MNETRGVRATDHRSLAHADLCGCALVGCEFLAGWDAREKYRHAGLAESEARVYAAAAAILDASGHPFPLATKSERIQEQVKDMARAALRAGFKESDHG